MIATRKREHSRKPDEQYASIEACSPGPYLELFGRGIREGWTVWGNQASDDYRPDWDTYAYNSGSPPPNSAARKGRSRPPREPARWNPGPIRMAAFPYPCHTRSIRCKSLPPQRNSPPPGPSGRRAHQASSKPRSSGTCSGTSRGRTRAAAFAASAAASPASPSST